MSVSVGVSAAVSIGGSTQCFARWVPDVNVDRVVNPDAICGNVDPNIERMGTGARRIRFSLVHDLTIPLLQQLLPLAGSALATGTYTADQSLSFVEIVVNAVGAVHRYQKCYLDQLLIRGQIGTLPVQVESTWVAQDEVEDSSFVFTAGTVKRLFPFSGGVTATLAAGAFDLDRFVWVVRRNLVSSFNGAVTFSDIGQGSRQVLMAFSVPYTAANKGHYWTYRDSAAGAALSLAVTNGTDTFTINMPKAVNNPQAPPIQGASEEIRLPETWIAARQTTVPVFNVGVVSP